MQNEPIAFLRFSYMVECDDGQLVEVNTWYTGRSIKDCVSKWSKLMPHVGTFVYEAISGPESTISLDKSSKNLT